MKFLQVSFSNVPALPGIVLRENLSSEVCEQQGCRPACASLQSDQRLCYSALLQVNFQFSS